MMRIAHSTFYGNDSLIFCALLLKALQRLTHQITCKDDFVAAWSRRIFHARFQIRLDVVTVIANNLNIDAIFEHLDQLLVLVRLVNEFDIQRIVDGSSGLEIRQTLALPQRKERNVAILFFFLFGLGLLDCVALTLLFAKHELAPLVE